MDTAKYIRTQHAWCCSRSEALRNVAVARVEQCSEWLANAGLAMGNVLVVGPRWGDELKTLQGLGVKELCGVEVVPQFAAECREAGFKCLEHDAESMGDAIKGKWNVYASHSLEHCHDIAAAAVSIAKVCDQWCYIALPIEFKGTKNPAHASAVRSFSDLLQHFPRWTEVKRYWKESKEKPKGEFHVLLTPPPDNLRAMRSQAKCGSFPEREK